MLWGATGATVIGSIAISPDGDRHGPTWAVRFPALAAAAVRTGPKQSRNTTAGNWRHRGRLGVCRSGTHHLSSQEIASHLAKFFYNRTSLSKPPVAPDKSVWHHPLPDRATHLGLGAAVHDRLKQRNSMGAASWPVRVPLSKADVPLAAMNVRLRPLS